MLKRTLHFVFVVLLSGGLFSLTGCIFKKKQPPVPPAAQAPTTAPQPVPQEPPPATSPQEEQKPETAVTKPKPKPKPKPRPAQTAQKPAPPPAPPKPEEKPQPQQEASARPPRIVIQEGGSSDADGQVSTTMGHDEATHRRLSTAQLLESTEANLRGLNRTLTADEQATVAQIKDYMEQARAATAQKDLVRAHNLALKAHLLSDELVKK